jgi:hypothetical protein
MKNLLLYCAVFILFFKNGFSQLRTDPLPIMDGRYKICNIDSVKTVYIIYAQKDSSIVKIASPKAGIFNCSSIVTGQYYDLKLQSRMSRTASKRYSGGAVVNGILVKLEGDKVSWDLFRCLNLKGLCIMPLINETN